MLSKFRRKINENIPLSLLRLRYGPYVFECPICGYRGLFTEKESSSGKRKHALCPRCYASERHRLQSLVLNQVIEEMDVRKSKVLHFAPEHFFQKLFSSTFDSYDTADLYMENVDYNVDLTNLPFPDKSYNLVFASHVLEHIADDKKAISEVRRILKPGGIAILPVPIVSNETIEYEKPIPTEENHVRAPGLDYFDRYAEFFSRVEIKASDSFPSKYQLYVWEDRSIWPTANYPMRKPMNGEKHLDFVPICFL